MYNLYRIYLYVNIETISMFLQEVILDYFFRINYLNYLNLIKLQILIGFD